MNFDFTKLKFIQQIPNYQRYKQRKCVGPMYMGGGAGTFVKNYEDIDGICNKPPKLYQDSYLKTPSVYSLCEYCLKLVNAKRFGSTNTKVTKKDLVVFSEKELFTIEIL